MRKGKKFVVALAAALVVSAIPTTAFGDVILYSSSKTSTSSSKETKGTISDTLSKVKTLFESGVMSLDEIEELGPDYAAAVETYVKESAKNTAKELGITLPKGLEEDDETVFRGPGVTQVKLEQVYHEEYETYELSMGDQFFLYSNVGNGAMTHEPVMVDIPANVAYTVEKDGIPYTYTSQTYIYEKGTYVMKLMGIINKNAPLSEQEEYQATFRFRIQDAPPAEETEEAQEVAADAGESGAASSAGSAMWNDLSTETSAKLPNLVDPEVSAEKETDAVVEETSAPAAEKTEPEAEPEAEQEPEIETPKREQRLELATGNYIVTLENGKQLKTSVPEGYIGAGPVTVSVSEDDVAYVQLYQDDEPVPFVNNDVIKEYGHYRVELDGESYHFTLAYGVSELSIFPAPAGMKISEARLNDQLLTLTSDQYVEMEKEGIYSFLLKGEQGERCEVTLMKDIVAPEINIMLDKSTAEIDYVSEDIEAVSLIRNGEPVEGFRGTLITDPGDYVLTVYDGAGNSTSANFTLKYQINAYGIFAVVLVILTIAGITAFTIHIKKNSKVR